MLTSGMSQESPQVGREDSPEKNTQPSKIIKEVP